MGRLPSGTSGRLYPKGTGYPHALFPLDHGQFPAERLLEDLLRRLKTRSAWKSSDCNGKNRSSSLVTGAVARGPSYAASLKAPATAVRCPMSNHSHPTGQQSKSHALNGTSGQRQMSASERDGLDTARTASWLYE